MNLSSSERNRILIIGAVLGALIGAGAAFIVVQRADAHETKPTVTPADGLKIGLGVLGLLRLVADTYDEK